MRKPEYNVLRSLAGTIGIAALLTFAVGCGDDTTEPDDTTITVPNAYTFESRFNEGNSSVGYNGQVVRNLLIQDIQTKITELGMPGATPITAAELLALYEYNDASNLTTVTSTGTLPPLEDKYSQIATDKNLSGKISDMTIPGYDKTADQLIRGWFQTIATNSQNADLLGTPMVYTTAEGVDLSQMINKLLLGSVSYYQGTGVYLQGILDQNNNDEDGSGGYTAMEHHWDEAFGYFGAARDYPSFTDVQLAGSTDDYVNDANSDGKIDFSSEYNFAFARNAGKRDNGASTDFTKTAFEAFVKGRAYIAGKGAQSEVVEQRKIAAETWEKVIGATIIHYINEVVADMDKLTEASSPEEQPDMNKHWAEMRGYAMALYYNPFRKISDQDMGIFQGYLGFAPVYDSNLETTHSEYRSKLGLARTILQNAYGFSGADVKNW